MRNLSADDFEAIVGQLKKLQRRTDHSERQISWQTAAEFKDALPGVDFDARELDAALVHRFCTDENCLIRPAYYPREDSCERLWGAISNVGEGPGRAALKARVNQLPLPLEPCVVAEHHSLVFLSYSLEDHHLAARVRLNLACWHIRTWMGEVDLNEGVNLFEAIEDALDRCDVLFSLVTSQSLASAWMNTEGLTARKKGKKVAVMVDASDTEVCSLVRFWMERRQAGNSGAPLGWLEGDAVEQSTALLRRFMRKAGPARVLKFGNEVSRAFDFLESVEIMGFYPAAPVSWPDSKPALSFKDVLMGLGLANHPPATHAPSSCSS